MILNIAVTTFVVSVSYLLFQSHRFYRSFFVAYLLFIFQHFSAAMVQYVEIQNLLIVCMILLLHAVLMLYLVRKNKARLLPLYRKKTITRLFQVWIGYSLHLIFIGWQEGTLLPGHLYLWCMTAAMPLIYALLSLTALPSAQRVKNA